MSLFFNVNGTVKEVNGWAGEGGGGGASGDNITIICDGEVELDDILKGLGAEINMDKLTTGTKIWFDKLPSPGDHDSFGNVVGRSGYLVINNVDWEDVSSERPVGVEFEATFQGSYYSDGGSSNMDVVYVANVFIPLNKFDSMMNKPRVSYSMMPSTDGEHTVERVSVNLANIIPEEGERIILFYSDAPLIKPEASNNEEPVEPAPINPSPITPVTP